MFWNFHFLGFLLLVTGVLGSCSPPRLGKDNVQCNTGNFNGCVSAKTLELSSFCNGDPALESSCLQQATLRSNKECAAFCMDITDCASCMKSIQMLGLSPKTCETGDMKYCKC